MPELTVKEVRLPELHLPELKRDEIVRALNEIHVPEVDLPRLARELPDRSRLALSGFDVATVVAGLVGAARRAAPVARRPRWPIAIGIVAVLALVAVALVRTPAVREATERGTRRARERVDAMRASMDTAAEATLSEPIEAVDRTSIDPRMSDVAEVMASVEDASEIEPTATPA